MEGARSLPIPAPADFMYGHDLAVAHAHMQHHTVCTCIVSEAAFLGLHISHAQTFAGFAVSSKCGMPSCSDTLLATESEITAA